jgi:hypothetical protein
MDTKKLLEMTTGIFTLTSLEKVNIMKYLLLTPFLLSLAIAPSFSLAREGKCEYAMNPSPQTVLEKLVGTPENAKALIYPIGLSAAPKTNKHIMFGFESEYTLSTTGPLLRIYMPRAEFGISREQWLSKTDAERIAWLKEYFAGRKVFSKDSGLTLIETVPGMEFLPKEPIKDDTGNLEIVLDPVNEFATFYKQVHTINTTFGPGSMQAMVSSPKESFFHDNGKLGFFTVMGEADALQKLRGGTDRYLKDPTKDVAKSFTHPFLGPLIKHKQGWLKKYLSGNAHGKLFSKASLKKVVYSEDSFKYTGTSAYRPDIGGSERVSIEVRDAHVNEAQLLEKVERIIAVYTRGTDRFEPFAKTSSLDTREVFEAMPEKAKTLLKTLFPAKIKVDENFNAEEVFTQEVYRNFSYPMRNWTPFLSLMGKKNYVAEVKVQQKIYLQKLQNIADALNAGTITKEEASRQVQGALTIFVKDSALNEHFENFIYQTL